jgi:hypothetical protein
MPGCVSPAAELSFVIGINIKERCWSRHILNIRDRLWDEEALLECNSPMRPNPRIALLAMALHVSSSGSVGHHCGAYSVLVFLKIVLE